MPFTFLIFIIRMKILHIKSKKNYVFVDVELAQQALFPSPLRCTLP